MQSHHYYRNPKPSSYKMHACLCAFHLYVIELLFRNTLWYEWALRKGRKYLSLILGSIPPRTLVAKHVPMAMECAIEYRNSVPQAALSRERNSKLRSDFEFFRVRYPYDPETEPEFPPKT